MVIYMYMKSADNPEEIQKITGAVLIELIGQEVAKKILPQFLKNRTLTVSCLSAELAEIIRSRQQEIVDKINDKLGKKEVDRIRYLL